MKPRHHLYLDDVLTEQLEDAASKPGASKSAIVAAALAFWFERRAENEIEHMFRIRLDRISRQLDRIERDGHILLESLALFVRFQLTVTAPIAENDRAAQAIGQDRFHRFVDQVARQLTAGKRSFGKPVSTEEEES